MEMSGHESDYFANHANKLRFPWSIYHRGLVRRVSTAIDRIPGVDILNVGSGPFLERHFLPDGRNYVACDVDKRAVDAVTQIYKGKIEAVVVEAGKALPFEDASFDIVFACDVIEHIPTPDIWLADLVRVLRPGGTLLLTTPNYGLSTLPLIEYTILEVLARRSGFSRFDIHPSRMNRSRLRRLLTSVQLHDIQIETVSLGWVLFASARRSV